MSGLISSVPDWIISIGVAATTVVAALIVHKIAHWIACRAAARTSSTADDAILRRLAQPSRWLFVAIALSAVEPALVLDATATATWIRIAGLITPALFGWLVIAVLGAASDIFQARSDISVADNLLARRRRTRISILYRIAVFVVVVATVCMMLITIPSIRSIGVTLIASAGLAGLAVGAAAQPALKNVIAGIQLAFTEPIRIDDVVIIDSEWGRIEEIRLTFVVVKTWDERRLVVPISKFLDESFQNWTRQTSALLGTVFIHVDQRADVNRIRSHFESVTKRNAKWDGRVAGLQVTDVFKDHMELRGLVSAADAGKLFDLRCDVREAMMVFIASVMPEALPRRLTELTTAEASQSQEAHQHTADATR